MNIAPHKSAWVRKGIEEKIASLEFGDVRKIAIIKHAALGDLVHTRPMIITLRKHFPNATITFSAISHYTNGIPEDLVDRVHIAYGKDKKYSERERWKSYRMLGPQDIIFDITQSSRSRLVTLLNKATLKIGYRHKGTERLLYDVALHRAENRFVAETILEQLHYLGIDYNWPLEYGYPQTAAIIEGDYILYFPTASEAFKIWPIENFANLINQAIVNQPQYKHVLLVGLAEWEKQKAEEITTSVKAKENFIVMYGGEDTQSLLANARCVVANDTGIRNFAIALDTPTVGIFPQGPLFSYAPKFGIHEIAYALDNTPPSVEHVYTKLTQALARIE